MNDFGEVLFFGNCFFVVIGVGVEAVHDGLVVHLLSFGITIYFCCHVFPSSGFVDILFFSCCFWFRIRMNEFKNIYLFLALSWDE
jgi:hypothetical protein